MAHLSWVKCVVTSTLHTVGLQEILACLCSEPCTKRDPVQPNFLAGGGWLGLAAGARASFLRFSCISQEENPLFLQHLHRSAVWSPEWMSFLPYKLVNQLRACISLHPLHPRQLALSHVVPRVGSRGLHAGFNVVSVGKCILVPNSRL